MATERLVVATTRSAFSSYRAATAAIASNQVAVERNAFPCQRYARLEYFWEAAGSEPLE